MMNVVMSSSSSKQKVQQTASTDDKPDNEALTEKINAVQGELSRITDKLAAAIRDEEFEQAAQLKKEKASCVAELDERRTKLR